jgi:uncharacterized protein (TIGR03437 family)
LYSANAAPTPGVGGLDYSLGNIGLNYGFDQNAPIIYAAQNQVNVIVPYSISGWASALAELIYLPGGNTVVDVLLGAVPVAATAPGIFTTDGSGKGSAAVTNQDGSLNSPSNPASRGSVVTFYATGMGETLPAGVDLKLASDPLPKPIASVSVAIAGMSAQILYAGAAPGFTGLMQVNASVPLSAPTGNSVSLVLTIGGVPSQPGVILAVK